MTPNALILNLWGYQLNLMTLLILGMIVALFYLCFTIQNSKRLDFADMFTKDGRKVSSSKVIQFVGAMASTWFIVKSGLQGTLTAELFGIYLAYTASVEGFSKFISAKYNYSETSVRDAVPTSETINQDGPIETTVIANLDTDGQVQSLEKTVKKG